MSAQFSACPAMTRKGMLPSTSRDAGGDESHHTFSGDCRASRESTPAEEEYQSARNSNENLFQNLQYYLLRQNAHLRRKFSLQASIATNDFDTFKRWIYQDYEHHRSQLKEAGANLFFRNESKYDIPNYDLVITFEPTCEMALVDQVQRALLLEHPSFSVEHRKHYFANYEEQALYISATNEFFEKFMQIAVSEADMDDSSPQECPVLQCSSLHRQTILYQILQQWRFEMNEEEEDGDFTQLKKHLVDSSKEGNDRCTIDRLTEAKMISKVFPLHYDESLSRLKKEWVCQFFSAQPLDTICEYFGIKIAIYFAFIGFYTKWLLYPTLFGLFITYFPFLLLCQSSLFSQWFQWCSWLFLLEEDLLNDILQFAFTIFNMFWSTIMLQRWEVNCRQYATKWSRALPVEFAPWHSKRCTKGDKSSPESDSRLKRALFKYCVTFPSLGFSLAITITLMLQTFNFQTWWDAELIEKGEYPSWTRFVPKILLALIINITNFIYYLIAVWLNDKEKYSNSESRENNLILKLVLFQFLNSFLPLFYIAFYLVDVDKEQLAAQLITRQVIGNFNEAVWPFIKESYRIATRTMRHTGADKDSAGAANSSDADDRMGGGVSKGELESCLFQYESTFDDYLELVIQFGYVQLFSSVFPLAALCAFLNNLIEIRSDAFKLCFVFQRPFANDQVRSIGEWSNVLFYLGIVAIVNNCALMAVTGQISRVFGFRNSAHILLTSVAIEHALLLMKWLIPNLLI